MLVTQVFTHSIRLADITNLILFPISKSPYWFIQVYLLILLCAPVLNYGLEMLSLNRIRLTILCLTLATIWSCAIGHNISNPNGYTFLQGMYVYALGRYIRRDDDFRAMISMKCSILLFVVFSIIAGCGYHVLKSPFWVAYNGFPVLIASIGMFLMFSRINFKSKIVNTVAHASLFVYLLQDGTFGFRFFYRWQAAQIALIDNFMIKLCFFMGIFLSFWLIALAITKVIDPMLKFESRVIEDIVPHKIRTFFR